ncbi:glycosyltransferase family 2 protein [Clostridium tyrobutyricum]|uniref:glycosyltransferase family 2 protein n=1 Tax=Clostridium tyrobutyricum TaxID=1519 RepID=UPI001C387047|nr:glycosyltransferase family 2 protein [Clostridium tyrobutyricum]MBV4428305.1 glycosyltransferase family 2 protein [Clostridium tyrobutyricum]MBV4443295.1 glycosyltransferase family 2 protein [Clostridium tyrobutyricum]
MNTPLVSIVTICWNRKKDILESLKGIFEIEYDNFEVIVVDNYSTDGTVESIENEFPEVKLIKMFKNIGIEAYNIGFKNARGKYIVILDDDSFPNKYAVERMIDKFENDEKLGMVAFDVRNYYNYDQVKSTEKQDMSKTDTAAKSKEYLMAFNGAGAGVRRELLESAGFYPEEFFLYWNEQDTAFRILNMDYKIEFFSDVISYHKYSPKNRSSWRAPYYYTRNAFWLIWKNYPAEQSLNLTMTMMYNCFYYSMEQKTFIYIKAMFNAFFGINKIAGKREVVKDYIWKNLRIPFNVAFTFFK